MVEISFRTEALDGPAGQVLVAAFAEEISRIYPGWDPTIGPSAQPHDFTPPQGRFIVGYEGDRPVACGGVKRLDKDVAEIKRIFVADDCRGRGVARRLLRRLESSALELGCRVVRLDTGDKQPDAFALFVSEGYREIGDYNANPYARHWFEKAIRPS